MKEKITTFLDKALDILLEGFLAIMFVFGILQFVVVAVTTLFGSCYGWLQYVASIVLFLSGLASVRLLVLIKAE